MGEYNASSISAQSDGNNEIFSASYKNDELFISARKHSDRVRVLKYTLPVLAVVIALVFSWFTFFSAPPSTEVVSLNGTGNGDDKLVMTHPTVEGYTSANKPYLMNALRAIQDPSKTGIIELEAIDAIMPLGNRGEAKVKANGGIYDNINGRMQLTQPFTVTTTDGISARFQSADVNISSSQLTTRERVEITRNNEHLAADSLRVIENGQVFVFEGNVTLVIDNAMEQSE